MKTFSMVVLAVLFCAPTVNAEQPHRAWLKYLSGEWKYDGDGGGGGEIDWKLTADGNAVIGTGTSNDGIKDAWVHGWDVKEQSIITQWFTADDKHGEVRYKVVDDKTVSGPAFINDATGTTKATVTVNKVSDNEYTVHWTHMTVNGSKAEDVNLVVKRK